MVFTFIFSFQVLLVVIYKLMFTQKRRVEIFVLNHISSKGPSALCPSLITEMSLKL